MTQEHPITPPPELVKQWDAECESGNNAEINSTFDALQQFACKAARWGADQELEACCKWLPKLPPWSADDLRKHRRPKLPSLKEQALQEINEAECFMDSANLGYDFTAVRRALEALPDD